MKGMKEGKGNINIRREDKNKWKMDRRQEEGAVKTKISEGGWGETKKRRKRRWKEN